MSLLVCIFLIAFIKSDIVGMGISFKIKKAKLSPWNLYEFLHLNPDKGGKGECYRFNEEIVRSHAHRFLGRFDSAVLHWEESPILDAVIERKFPTNNLPEKIKEEDIFQAGLYALALSESGVSCAQAKLVTIYCLQDTAKRCLEGNHLGECWKCSEARKFIRGYREKEIKKYLKRLDDIWYSRRKAKASPSVSKCSSCPFCRNGICNNSAI